MQDGADGLYDGDGDPREKIGASAYHDWFNGFRYDFRRYVVVSFPRHSSPHVGNSDAGIGC